MVNDVPSQEAQVDFNSELVIGLVCAAGTESKQVVDLVKERLGLAGYDSKLVKVSEQVIPLVVETLKTYDSKYQRYDMLMKAGNECRKKSSEEDSPGNAILALGSAVLIQKLRSDQTISQNDEEPKPTAYIIDSLKRPEEVAELRRIYSSGFVLFGIHEEESRRLRHLVENVGMKEHEARELIARDSEEKLEPHGQRVNDTFHLADLFVRVTDDRDRLRNDLQRLVELMFGNPFITPTFEEHAMFLAFSAALRSADLSRQVGAVVTKNKQILATGANECPQAGGGLYWPLEPQGGEATSGYGCASDVSEGRDYTRDEGDSNRAEQLKIIDRIVAEVKARNEDLDEDQFKQILEGSSIKNITEYGRVVHAEMEALLSCARNGISTADASLYCTTFPCHNCAKHIIAAGITEVIYVEPYPKSRALDLHNDSITTLPVDRNENNKLVFKPFEGVGPRRFFELFSMNLGWSYALERKRIDGKRKDWFIGSGKLRIQMKPMSYLELEKLACEEFGRKLPTEESTDEEKNPSPSI